MSCTAHDRNRQPPGRPSGGQYAAEQRSSSGLRLETPGPPFVRLDVAVRADLISASLDTPSPFPARLGEPGVEWGVNESGVLFTSVTWSDGGDHVIVQDDGVGGLDVFDENTGELTHDEIEDIKDYAQAVHANVSQIKGSIDVAVTDGELHDQVAMLATTGGRDDGRADLGTVNRNAGSALAALRIGRPGRLR